MAKRKMEIKFNNTFETDVQTDCNKIHDFSVKDFIDLHEKFMMDKSLEGLAERTLKEHINNLNYFIRYVDESIQSDANCVAININKLQ